MSIEERLDRIEKMVSIGYKEVLNTSEVALMMNVAVQTVRNMMHARTIPYYKKGGKAYFSKSEIEKWMLRDRVSTGDEIKSEASTYVEVKKMNH